MTSQVSHLSEMAHNMLHPSSHSAPKPANHNHEEEGFLEHLNEALENGGGSLLLLIMAIISISIANVEALSAPWLGFWGRHWGPAIGHHHLTRKDWVNEGLMTFFFFAVGLEIKKELLEGSLASASKAALPCVAALGGMVVPMGLYALVQMWCHPNDSYDGVAVPMATDIAFAMGVFCCVRKFLPPATAPFLLALATVDDLGAIAVIVVSGGGSLHMEYIAGFLVLLGIAYLLGQKGIEKSSLQFGILGVGMWYCLLTGGINADIAGVAIAMCIPMRSKHGEEVVERLIGTWSPWAALVVLPIFALANCAVPMRGFGDYDTSESTSAILAVPMGVMLGLIFGKPLGIFGFVLIPTQLGLLSLPTGLGNKNVLSVGFLGGIGFTMCLFLVENSLEGPTAQMTKLAVLVASLLSAGLAAVHIVMSGSAPKSKATVVALNHGRGSADTPFAGA